MIPDNCAEPIGRSCWVLGGWAAGSWLSPVACMAVACMFCCGAEPCCRTSQGHLLIKNGAGPIYHHPMTVSVRAAQRRFLPGPSGSRSFWRPFPRTLV